MHARHIFLAVLAAAITLTYVASAGPAAAKQRVAVTSKIAFTSTPSSSTAASHCLTDELYVVNADGSRPRRLTRTEANRSPIWSPNSRRIAFVQWTVNVSQNPLGTKPRT